MHGHDRGLAYGGGGEAVILSSEERAESETQAYRVLMRMARKLVKADPRYKIVPNPKDPLRLFTIERDIGLTTVKVMLVPEPMMRRSSKNRRLPSGKRTGYRWKISYMGLYCDHGTELALRSRMTVSPRGQAKLHKAIEEKIIPGWYMDLEREKRLRENAQRLNNEWEKNVMSVDGLQVSRNPYTGDCEGKLSQCPLTMRLRQEAVEVEGLISYDDLKRVAQAMGWGR